MRTLCCRDVRWPPACARLDLVLVETDDGPKDLLGMLSQERSALDLGRGIDNLIGISHRQVLAALWMVHLDDGPGPAQRLLVGELFHGKNRAAGHLRAD